MKFKTTQKAVKEGYRNIIEIGYCDLQFLLNYETPIAYTCGVYGWNSDIYQIDNNTVIVTGYRPFGNVNVDYKLIREYNKKAGKIVLDWNIINKKELLGELLNEFVKKVLGE